MSRDKNPIPTNAMNQLDRIYPAYLGVKIKRKKNGTIVVQHDNKERETHRWMISETGKLIPALRK